MILRALSAAGLIAAMAGLPPARALKANFFRILHTKVGGTASEGEVVKREELTEGGADIRRLLSVGAVEGLYDDEGGELYAETAQARRAAARPAYVTMDFEDDADTDAEDAEDAVTTSLGFPTPNAGEVKAVEGDEGLPVGAVPPSKLTGNNLVTEDADASAEAAEGATAANTVEDAYSDKSDEELKGIANVLGIRGYAAMKRETLLTRIRAEV